MSDLIRRSDLEKALNEWIGDSTLTIFEAVDRIPTVERKRGKWVEREEECEYRCSECGKIVFADDENELNFCCSCGADMRKESE